MAKDVLDHLVVGASREARRIARRDLAGVGPTVVWLGGFKSDMTGTKAQALADWAHESGRAFTRFDYSGHGLSEGRFEDGTIGKWAEEARAVVASLAGPVVIVGSSMGGWIALLVAKTMTPPPVGMVLIAPAVDFTEALMWAQFPPEIRRAIEVDGRWVRPSAYDAEGYPITRDLIEDGRRHLVLGAPVETGCPVHILQGMRDDDVPWTHAMSLVERMARDDVTVTLVKDADHRLSRPEDINCLIAAVEAFA